MNLQRILAAITAGIILIAACDATKRDSNADGYGSTANHAVPTSALAPEDRWEYVTFAPPDIVYDETLNRLGSDGWELVTARRVKSPLGDMAYEVTLRRKWRADRPSTTAEEQSAIALRSAIDKETLALEAARANIGGGHAATSVSATTKLDERPKPQYRIVGYEEHSEPIYEQVAVDAANYQYHLLQCPKAAQFNRVIPFATIYAQRIPRAADCAGMPHRVVSTRKWQVPIKERVQPAQ